LPIDLTGIIGTAIGLGGFGFGIFSYFRNELERRKQTIFPLIEEFNTDRKLFVAKSLLDNYSFRREVLARFSFTQNFDVPDEAYIKRGSIMAEGKGGFIAEYENPKDLKHILRNHEDGDVTASDEIAIRMCFDSLLDFFVKLEYLLSMDLIKKTEMEYFDYYLKKTADNAAVVGYMKTYKFPLKGKLNPSLKVVAA
jgi:hypothetical protein